MSELCFTPGYQQSSVLQQRGAWHVEAGRRGAEQLSTNKLTAGARRVFWLVDCQRDNKSPKYLRIQFINKKMRRKHWTQRFLRVEWHDVYLILEYLSTALLEKLCEAEIVNNISKYKSICQYISLFSGWILQRDRLFRYFLRAYVWS